MSYCSRMTSISSWDQERIGQILFGTRVSWWHLQVNGIRNKLLVITEIAIISAKLLLQSIPIFFYKSHIIFLKKHNDLQKDRVGSFACWLKPPGLKLSLQNSLIMTTSHDAGCKYYILFFYRYIYLYLPWSVIFSVLLSSRKYWTVISKTSAFSILKYREA